MEWNPNPKSVEAQSEAGDEGEDDEVREHQQNCGRFLASRADRGQHRERRKRTRRGHSADVCAIVVETSEGVALKFSDK